MGKNDFKNDLVIRGAKGVSTICANIIFILDTSISMEGDRIKQLNYGMRESLKMLVEESLKQEIDVYVRVIKYNDNIKWVIGEPEKGVPAEEAVKKWKNLTTDGSTNTAGAIKESLKALRTEYFGNKNKKPIIILITDGDSNNRHEMEKATDMLKVALSGESGREKTIRIAIGVEDYNEGELKYFASVGTVKDNDGVHEKTPFVFSVEDSDKIASIIKNVTVSSLASVNKTNPVTFDSSSDLVIKEDPFVIDTSTNTTDFWP